MTLIDVIKLIFKHKILLFGAPIVMSILAIILTVNPKFDYETQAIMYTGIASGTSVEMGKKSDYFASNTAFDNLINIIKSRETQEEVAVRLLTQHLLIDGPRKQYISAEHLNELKELVPEEIYTYLVKSKAANSKKTDSIASTVLPPGVSREAYEQTVDNLMKLMNSSNDNFIYELLNYEHKFYSIKTISEISVLRIGSSDLIKLTYKAGDPGICKQTLDILNEVCSRKYKDFKQNGSDAVVKYFLAELAKSEKKLKKVEDRLLKYNQENSIINYYEQSKAVAVVREDMEVAYKNKLAQLAGSRASKKKLEEKLKVQGYIQNKNDEVLKDKDRLGKLKYQLVLAEAKSDGSAASMRKIRNLRNESIELQEKIDKKVNEIFKLNNSIEGVPMTKMMPQWIDNLVDAENLAAEVELMTKQSKEFQKEVEKYAPAGANIKRIEREISVIEEEYLEILRGLNLAKLKYQDTQIAGNLKMVDPAYFPLNPIPSKRKIVVVAAGFLSFVLILGTILLMEFFDDTLRNDQIASEKLELEPMGMLPKISMSSKYVDLVRIQNRLMDFIMHNFEHTFSGSKGVKRTKVVVVMSTGPNEGKSVIVGNIARKLKGYGKKVLFLNHSNEEKQEMLVHSNPWLYKLLGYQDPRVDYSHPFLDKVRSYLTPAEYKKYEVNDAFSHAKTYRDLSFDNGDVNYENLDYVIVELPNILEQNYPAEILENADLAILVCRSNRLWTKADTNILNNIKELVNCKLQFIINGVVIDQVESLLGEIPKKRSIIRKKLKNLFRFQFHSDNQI